MSTQLGKYQLVAEIARGGMGIVYLAVAQGPGGFSKLLVLKELKAELVDDPAFRDMFLEEARLAARLNHPNIVQTFEIGEDLRRPYIVMDYLDGVTLSRIVRRQSPAFTRDFQLRILCEVLQGLHYAHTLRDFDGSELGIVHRDVTPQNVFVTFDGQAKLVDFGIAKAIDTNIETRTGVLKGKPAYMAPEQVTGVVDPRADVFSAGVLVWEAAAGQRMWAKKNDQKVYALIELQVKASVTNPKVALVTKNDAYGSGIRSAFLNGLQINGAAPTESNLLDAVYQDPNATGTGTPIATVFNQVNSFAPDIVVLVGTDEATNSVMKPLEQGGKHPYYLVSDGLKKPALTQALDLLDGTTATSNGLQARLRGTQPGVVTQQLTQNFFNLGYKTAYGANSVLSYGMAGSYDIGYMIAYAAAATKGGAVTGTVLADNMKFLVGGTPTDVGTASLSKGFTSVLNGTALDFNGASGPLDFDLAKGEAPSDYSVWCVKRDPNTPASHIYNEVAGLYYQATTQTLQGTYDCPAN